MYKHFGHFTLKLNFDNNNSDGKVSLDVYSTCDKNRRLKNRSAVYIVKNAAAHVPGGIVYDINLYNYNHTAVEFASARAYIRTLRITIMYIYAFLRTAIFRISINVSLYCIVVFMSYKTVIYIGGT